MHPEGRIRIWNFAHPENVMCESSPPLGFTIHDSKFTCILEGFIVDISGCVMIFICGPTIFVRRTGYPLVYLCDFRSRAALMSGRYPYKMGLQVLAPYLSVNYIFVIFLKTIFVSWHLWIFIPRKAKYNTRFRINWPYDRRRRRISNLFYYVVTWNVKTYVSHPLKCRMCQKWLKWCSDPPPTTTPKLQLDFLDLENFLVKVWGGGGGGVSGARPPPPPPPPLNSNLTFWT